MEYRRPTRENRRSTGAVPTEYERIPTPVTLVNPDGSRRRDDVDDTGAQQRRGQGTNDDHFWHCWGKKDGPGAQFRVEVLGELDSLKKRSWIQGGGLAVLGAIGMAILAAWLSSNFNAIRLNAVKRQDVAEAIQKGALMAVAKAGDDFRQQLQQAAADTSPPPVPMTTKARR